MYLSGMPIFLPITFIEKEKCIRYNLKQKDIRKIDINDRIKNIFSKKYL